VSKRFSSLHSSHEIAAVPLLPDFVVATPLYRCP
jgi:hypothetical protein